MKFIITCYSLDILDFFKKHFFNKIKDKIEFNTEKTFFELITSFYPKDYKHIILHSGNFDKELGFYKPMFCSHLFINLSCFSRAHFELINNFLEFPLLNDNFFEIYNKLKPNLIQINSLKTQIYEPKPINKQFFNQHLVPLPSQKKILILGNGPSLKEIDFMNLNIPTMGMNSAYRYWEKYNWYPDFYISMDDKLIETHHLAMKDMVINKKIRSAFFADDMFDNWQPELKKHPRVYSFGRIGLSKFFQSIDDHKMTTGAWAVRFAAYLGFTEIYLAGIDCNYIEILPEAGFKPDGSLEMKETPQNNPNYFFEDYQQKGDKYNVPNPEVHQGRLHLDSFRVLKADCLKYDYGIKIYNLSKKSLLEKNKIFKLKNIN